MRNENFLQWAKKNGNQLINFKYYLRAKKDYNYIGTPKEFFKLVEGKEGKATVSNYVKLIVKPKPASKKDKADTNQILIDLLSDSVGKEKAMAIAQILNS